MRAEDNISEAQYMYMNELDCYFEDFVQPVIRATKYNKVGASMLHLKGSEMVGRNCPTCSSPLVARTNSKDQRKFVACDKSRRTRCPFTIGWKETLYDRTERIENKITRGRN
jgi:ssDNA-binding Zn-finger/Zn-ribbon topoisomerase 1